LKLCQAELELQKLGDQHEQALNKITQNEQMISSFERRNVDLTMEISRNKASLESLEAERNMLADEKVKNILF
jgi:predicted RNase H-like nuclease (RuvC/YqgF family)